MISKPRIKILPDHSDYVSPGLILEDLMADEGWSDKVCAELSGLDVSVIRSLLADEIIVTPEIAKGLAKLSNFGEGSWLKSESIYQENIALYEGRKKS